jgi:heterodisulfide reductase subunit B
MVLKRRKIKMKKNTESIPVEKKETEQKENKQTMEEINDFVATMDEKRKEKCQIDEGENVVLEMINEKKENLARNKKDLVSLECKIKKDCSEIEALEYIASGEPTMSIMDLLNMIQDFVDTADEYNDVTEMLEDMSQTILKSTIDSIRR